MARATTVGSKSTSPSSSVMPDGQSVGRYLLSPSVPNYASDKEKPPRPLFSFLQSDDSVDSAAQLPRTTTVPPEVLPGNERMQGRRSQGEGSRSPPRYHLAAAPVRLAAPDEAEARCVPAARAQGPPLSQMEGNRHNSRGAPSPPRRELSPTQPPPGPLLSARGSRSACSRPTSPLPAMLQHAMARAAGRSPGSAAEKDAPPPPLWAGRGTPQWEWPVYASAESLTHACGSAGGEPGHRYHSIPSN